MIFCPNITDSRDMPGQMYLPFQSEALDETLNHVLHWAVSVQSESPASILPLRTSQRFQQYVLAFCAGIKPAYARESNLGIAIQLWPRRQGSGIDVEWIAN